MITINQQEEIRNAYFKLIIDEDNNLIKNRLPKHYEPNFLEITTGILELLKKEIIEWQDLVKESSDEEIINQINIYKEKVDIISMYLDEYNNSNKKEIDKKLNNERTLIFGKNILGNIPIFNDIKNISIEYYDEINTMLNTLKYDDLFNKSEKNFKKLANNNSLKDLYELKSGKLRIIVQLLNANFIYVDMIRLKKDDNSTKDRNEPKNRKEALNNHYGETIDRINNKEKIEELCNEHEEYLNIINNMLHQTKIKEVI